MRCVLLYNPASGRQRHRHAEQIRRTADALSALGHQVELTSTTAPGSATLQTQGAVRGGAEVIFACGGDGTIHEVLQGLVSETGEPSAALGIIPLGSANALARHLRLSLDPVQAALAQINCASRTIPVGKVEYVGRVRYFTVMAGAGPDGALVYDLLSAHKTTMGRWEYYLRAARLFATRRFEPFEVECADAASGDQVTRKAVSAMAVRVGDLGGLFSRLAGGGAGVEDAQLQLLILSGPAWLSLPLWFVCGWLGLNGVNRFLRCVKTESFACRPVGVPSPHFEADGEWLGRIPMRVSVVRDAVRILMPDV
ncbi:MAG: diacylglycerol kinase family protein [Terracidiphilus sp.]|nr:diacylglycerol kinase family protein [Terracidiphilus sp.]